MPALYTHDDGSLNCAARVARRERYVKVSPTRQRRAVGEDRERLTESAHVEACAQVSLPPQQRESQGCDVDNTLRIGVYSVIAENRIWSSKAEARQEGYGTLCKGQLNAFRKTFRWSKVQSEGVASYHALGYNLRVRTGHPMNRPSYAESQERKEADDVPKDHPCAISWLLMYRVLLPLC
jgi:hypothetical protein